MLKRFVIILTVAVVILTSTLVVVCKAYKSALIRNDENYTSLYNELEATKERARIRGEYCIRSRDTGKLYFTGTYFECCELISHFEINFGECIILLTSQDWLEYA